MKKLFTLFLVLTVALAGAMAQTKLQGVVKVAGTGAPLQGVKVTLLQQNISTQTNANGEFVLSHIEAGDDEVSISREGYFQQIKMVSIKSGATTDLGVVNLIADTHQEMKQEIVLQLSENALDAGDDSRTQSISGSLSSRGDVYNAQTSYSFSPMRFRMRGYDQNYETTYINGIMFNGLERGEFNYSGLGGLNDAFRNQEETVGLTPNNYSYGNLGSTTNINVKASSYAAGSKASLAYSNRAYKLRAQYTYGTGLLPSGWAFAASAVVRWSDKGIVDGTFYNSAGYFLSAEKVFGKHSLSLITYGAPTQRAQQSAATQETYDLTGSIYYNSYWGYQDGKIRNSRIVKSFDPTAILSHEFKINEKNTLRSGLAYHYSLYSNSALNFYNATDPRPDYYRNMPSYQTEQGAADWLTYLWKTDRNTRQLNWDEMYRSNYVNRNVAFSDTARYSLERRHNNLEEIMLNSTFISQVNNNLKLTAGIQAKKSKAMHYKTMEDLMGGSQWIDIDQFAERDFPSNPDIIQNDLNNPNKVIKQGDKFGYDYDINVRHASAFIQNEWVLPQLDIFYAANVSYTDFYRYTRMKNGRDPKAQDGTWTPKGKEWYTVNPSVKAGITYKIDGRNKLYINGLAETRAPQVNNSYVSVRTKDTAVPMADERVLSGDINYAFIYPNIRGRVSGFFTQTANSSDLYGYYDDEKQTFVNFMLTDFSKRYMGVELGVSYKINSSFTVSAAGTYAQYKYVSDGVGIKSAENGSFADVVDSVKINGLHVATGPQLAANITIDYFHPKMWFVDLTLNYFDNNFLDFAPNRFLKSNLALYTTDEIKQALATQEKLQGGFLLDLSVGKVIYLKNRKSLNFNLSASNLLNSKKMITGGYQQARLPLDGSNIDVSGLRRFDNKYYYAWGFNMFFNVGLRF